MDKIILKALLDRLGINPVITRYEDIHRVQQSVYEESVHGADLGYVFGDYPVGKFSPELRDVHKELSNALVE